MVRFEKVMILKIVLAIQKNEWRFQMAPQGIYVGISMINNAIQTKHTEKSREKRYSIIPAQRSKTNNTRIYIYKLCFYFLQYLVKHHVLLIVLCCYL